MNKTILLGRLTKDAEVRYSNNQMGNQIAIARFTLAVNRRFHKDGEADADFINCIAFGKIAEFLDKYGKKGTKFLSSGRIETGKYVNQNGYDVYYTRVIVEEIEFAESKSSTTNQDQSKNISPNEGFMEIPEGIEEELPFN